jgi:hypothetical protein
MTEYTSTINSAISGDLTAISKLKSTIEGFSKSNTKSHSLYPLFDEIEELFNQKKDQKKINEQFIIFYLELMVAYPVDCSDRISSSTRENLKNQMLNVHDSIRAKLAQHEQTIKTNAQTIEQNEQKMAELQKEKEKLWVKVENSEEDNARLARKLVNADADKVTLFSHLEAIETENDKLLDEQQQTKQKFEILQTEYELVAKANAELKANNERLTEIVGILGSELIEFMSAIDVLMMRHDAEILNMAALHLSLMSNFKSTEQNLKSRIENLESTLKDVNLENLNLFARNAVSKSQLKQTTKQLAQFQTHPLSASLELERRKKLHVELLEKHAKLLEKQLKQEQPAVEKAKEIEKTKEVEKVKAEVNNDKAKKTTSSIWNYIPWSSSSSSSAPAQVPAAAQKPEAYVVRTLSEAQQQIELLQAQLRAAQEKCATTDLQLEMAATYRSRCAVMDNREPLFTEIRAHRKENTFKFQYLDYLKDDAKSLRNQKQRLHQAIKAEVKEHDENIKATYTTSLPGQKQELHQAIKAEVKKHDENIKAMYTTSEIDSKTEKKALHTELKRKAKM